MDKQVHAFDVLCAVVGQAYEEERKRLEHNEEV